MFRGELSDLSKDPLAEARAQIDTKDAPTLGDPQSPVTLVEYSDFQCPVCRSLHDSLRAILPRYPQVRVEVDLSTRRQNLRCTVWTESGWVQVLPGRS